MDVEVPTIGCSLRRLSSLILDTDAWCGGSGDVSRWKTHLDLANVRSFRVRRRLFAISEPQNSNLLGRRGSGKLRNDREAIAVLEYCCGDLMRATHSSKAFEISLVTGSVEQVDFP